LTLEKRHKRQHGFQATLPLNKHRSIIRRYGVEGARIPSRVRVAWFGKFNLRRWVSRS